MLQVASSETILYTCIPPLLQYINNRLKCWYYNDINSLNIRTNIGEVWWKWKQESYKEKSES